jgi:hypothetical protein
MYKLLTDALPCHCTRSREPPFDPASWRMSELAPLNQPTNRPDGHLVRSNDPPRSGRLRLRPAPSDDPEIQQSLTPR